MLCVCSPCVCVCVYIVRVCVCLHCACVCLVPVHVTCAYVLESVCHLVCLLVCLPLSLRCFLPSARVNSISHIRPFLLSPAVTKRQEHVVGKRVPPAHYVGYDPLPTPELGQRKRYERTNVLLQQVRFSTSSHTFNQFCACQHHVIVTLTMQNSIVAVASHPTLSPPLSL